MILADTVVWIDYLRGSDPSMRGLLAAGQIAMHPCIVAELALRSLHNRKKTLATLDALATVKIARLGEIRRMIESHMLYSRGIGLTDAHLMASCLLSPGTKLWTRDAALHRVAVSLGIDAQLP
mgnify:CR=1 FL=1